MWPASPAGKHMPKLCANVYICPLIRLASQVPLAAVTAAGRDTDFGGSKLSTNTELLLSARHCAKFWGCRRG